MAVSELLKAGESGAAAGLACAFSVTERYVSYTIDWLRPPRFFDTSPPEVSMQVCRAFVIGIAFLAVTLPAIAQNIKSRNLIPYLGELTASNGEKGDAMGSSVAISGNTVVMSGDCDRSGGNPYCNTNHSGGMAYVFQMSQSGWSNMTQVAELTESDATGYDEFGWTVAIDGDTVVVGAPGTGAAYVYVKPSTGWANMTETAKLSTAFGYSEAGLSVAVGGGVIVLGAPNAEPAGGAYVFLEPRGGWSTRSQPNAELTGSDTSGGGGSFFGASVSIEGNTIAVGATDTDVNLPGAVYVYVEPEGGWVNSTQTAELTPSDGILYEWFGFSVSIAGDSIAVGAPSDDVFPYDGAVYMFTRPSGGWVNMTETAKLTGSTGNLGWSVAASENTVVAGSFAENDSHGAAYVFARPSTGWASTSTPSTQLMAPFGEQFGFSLGASGNVSVVGAPYTTVNSNPRQGAAFVFGN
ncbi:MAG: hypothetical protein ABSH02_19110 [Candidatus Sulfotelmatobacter sp.]